MTETMVFCTLFDSGYLDKGLVLYDSLCKNAGDFKLYVAAFDETCRRILTDYAGERLIVVGLDEFESAELLEAKKNRNAREYCWTCSCHVIKYVLEHYGEPRCTYIDADMYFYQSPRCLLEDITKAGCDVGIMRHGFIQNKENMRYIRTSGEYCVEFNTFFHTENGMRVLNWWCRQCLACCTEKADEIHFGDQKYLEQFQKLFAGVYVHQNQGAGVAPWNIARFELENEDGGGAILLREKETKKMFPLIFYHFQQIRYLSERSADINAYLYPHRASLKLRDTIYLPYMRRLSEKRRFLSEKYGLNLDEQTAYAQKRKLGESVRYLIYNERDPVIGLRWLCRVLFRKRHDYLSW